MFSFVVLMCGTVAGDASILLRLSDLRRMVARLATAHFNPNIPAFLPSTTCRSVTLLRTFLDKHIVPSYFTRCLAKKFTDLPSKHL